MYCLWQLLCYSALLSRCTSDHMPYETRILLSGSLRKRFANRCSIARGSEEMAVGQHGAISRFLLYLPFQKEWK